MPSSSEKTPLLPYEGKKKTTISPNAAKSSSSSSQSKSPKPSPSPTKKKKRTVTAGAVSVSSSSASTGSTSAAGGSTKSPPKYHRREPDRNVSPRHHHHHNRPSLELIRAASKKVATDNIQIKRRVVHYDGASSFVFILFQMYGSVWPKVFPWCLLISIMSGGIFYLRAQDIVDITIQSNEGHSFVSILVSFLIVTRTTITYSRFMEARQYLEDLYRSSRELIQYTTVLTMTDKDIAAQDWRRRVAYRTIIMLRMAIAAIQCRGDNVAAWEILLHQQEHADTPLLLPHGIQEDSDDDEDYTSTIRRRNGQRRDQHSPKSTNHHNYYPNVQQAYALQDLAHGPRTLLDENMRVPVIWVYNVRQAILEQRHDPTILPNRPLAVNETMKLNALCDDFHHAFQGLKKLTSTPFPFPLVQMTRTFLFFWMFSLPLVLIPDYNHMWEICLLMFFCTYGFLGLEYVNMELEDPHGQDPNDFPGYLWAQQVFEDIYINIYQVDGLASAHALRSLVSKRILLGRRRN